MSETTTGPAFSPVWQELFARMVGGLNVPASQMPDLILKPCPFCGATQDRLVLGFSGNHCGPWYTILCPATAGGCGCSQNDSQWSSVVERWNRRAVVGDDQKILKAATTNRIWLNAMTHRLPSDDTLIALGQTVLDMLRQPENLVTLDQDNPCEAMRKIGQLQPVLFLRINQS